MKPRSVSAPTKVVVFQWPWGNAHPQALAAPAAPIAARHVGGGPSLIDKHQALGIQVELPLEPGLAFRQDVRAGLLAGMGGLFLRVIA
jgi:hypothetical protein